MLGVWDEEEKMYQGRIRRFYTRMSQKTLETATVSTVTASPNPWDKVRN